MENLTGGTPPVRYLPCVVPCKLYFAIYKTSLSDKEFDGELCTNYLQIIDFCIIICYNDYVYFIIDYFCKEAMIP